MAIDPGERRTGVAVSDDLGLLAHPRQAIIGSSDALPAAVAALVTAEGADELVVGMPVTMRGGSSAQTRTVGELVRLLRGSLSIPVTTWDERLSSAQAARTVKGADRRRRGELDSAAAAVILQAVLDSRRARPAR